MASKYFLIIALIVFVFTGCGQKQKENRSAESKQNVRSNSQNIQTVIFKNDTTKNAAIGGFGYNIYVINDKDTLRRIHQPTIPAIPGQKGFKTFSDAEKASALAVQKIKEGNSFPALSIEELDSLGIK